jgi:hypothetical protein
MPPKPKMGRPRMKAAERMVTKSFTLPPSSIKIIEAEKRRLNLDSASEVIRRWTEEKSQEIPEVTS